MVGSTSQVQTELLFANERSLDNRCLACFLDQQEFNLGSYRSLNSIQGSENYFCSFDSTCRKPGDDKMSFRSCERGIEACLLFRSRSNGMINLMGGDEEMEDYIDIKLASDKIDTV